MKLVMTLLVRDEADIIRSNILYHLDRGVDFVIATDNMSRDGTLDILRDFEAQGIVHLIIEPGQDYEQWRWVTRMARLAYTRYSADWVINNDADEFWWSDHHDLKTILSNVPAKYDAVVAPRTNFIPHPVLFGHAVERMTIREVVAVNSLGRPLPPKTCHRGMADVEVAQGNHHLLAPHGARVFNSAGLEVLHLPVRSPSQLETKVVNTGSSLARNTTLPSSAGGAIRHLYQIHQVDGLSEYWRSCCLTEEAVADGIKQGRLTRDTRLRDYMCARGLLG